jgi:hypothetical protein
MVFIILLTNVIMVTQVNGMDDKVSISQSELLKFDIIGSVKTHILKLIVNFLFLKEVKVLTMVNQKVYQNMESIIQLIIRDFVNGTLNQNRFLEPAKKTNFGSNKWRIDFKHLKLFASNEWLVDFENVGRVFHPIRPMFQFKLPHEDQYYRAKVAFKFEYGRYKSKIEIGHGNIHMELPPFLVVDESQRNGLFPLAEVFELCFFPHSMEYDPSSWNIDAKKRNLMIFYTPANYKTVTNNKYFFDIKQECNCLGQGIKYSHAKEKDIYTIFTLTTSHDHCVICQKDFLSK